MRLRFALASMVLVCAGMLSTAAHAADRVVAGTLGGQAPLWPFYIAMQKGFLAAQGIDMELNFAPSGASVVQQLTGGSLDVAASVGMPEPMEAIDKGAALALVRIIGKAAPYALVAKASVKTLADLRGKTISAGLPGDITSIYFDRMMAPTGLKTGDYDMIFAGVAAARLAALEAGAADAAMLLPPLNFHAEKAGLHTLALAAIAANDFPFTGMAVLRSWAASHKDVVLHLVAATDQSVAWLADPGHRAEAVDLLVTVGHANREDAEASYDYLAKIGYFEPSPKISRERLQTLIDIERARGLVGATLTVDRLIMPGVTQLAP